MSITEVRNQGYEDNTDAAVWVVNPPAAGFAAGNLLVAFLFHEDTATAATITDTDGNTWTRVTTQQMPGGEQIYLSPYWCIPAASLPSSDTITFTWGTNVRPKILLIREFNSSTGWPASPQDVFTSASGTGTSLSAGTTTATAQAEEVVVVSYGVDGNATTFTGDAGYSGGVTFGGSFSGSQGDEKGYSQYKVLSSTGTQTNTVTRSAGTVWWAGAIVAFKNNSGGTGATVTAVPATALGSAPVPAVTSNPGNTVAPAITGVPAEGQTLTCGTGTWTGTPTPTFTYQWYSSVFVDADSFYPSGEGVTYDIETGETANTIALASGDIGRYFFCAVTATNSAGNRAKASADAGPVVDNDATVTAVVADATGTAPVAVVSGSGSATVTAVVALAAGSAPVAVVTGAGNATVTAVPATALGSAPPANSILSSVVNAPAVIALGSAPIAVISSAGNATVTGVPAVALGSAPVGVLSGAQTWVAVVADATGAGVAATVSAGATVAAVIALAQGQAPRPTISPAPAGGVSGDVAATFAEAFS